jgi:hypothetical protein
MASISICIPFHLRGKRSNRAYDASFKHYASLPYTVHLCGSEGSLSSAFASKFINNTTHYIEVPQGPLCTLSKGNEVLRKKFNDSLSTLPPSDWYCLAGADDIIPASFFEWLAKQDGNQIAMAGQTMGSPMIMVDMNNYPNKRSIIKVHLQYRIQLQLTGGVNCFTGWAMDICDWQPYQREGCETGAELFIAERGQILHTPGYVIMPKEPTSLNQMRKIAAFHPNHPVTMEDEVLVKSYLQ